MKQVCASVDFQQMCQILMLFLSRKFVNENNAGSGFKLKSELSLIFFERLISMNTRLFKKTQIVKEVMTPLLESVSLDGCDSLEHLKRVIENWGRNSKLLL